MGHPDSSHIIEFDRSRTNGITVAARVVKIAYYIDYCLYIVSWGNFGHGATSVKKSLRNHFGRINNV